MWVSGDWRVGEAFCGDARVVNTVRAVKEDTNARERWLSCGPKICTTTSIAKSVRSNTVSYGLLPCRCVSGSVVLLSRLAH